MYPPYNPFQRNRSHRFAQEFSRGLSPTAATIVETFRFLWLELDNNY